MQLSEKAKKVLDVLETLDITANDLKEGTEEAELVGSWSTGEGLWYGVTEGYIDPEAILVPEDARRVLEAIKTLQEFEGIWTRISFEM